MASATATDPSTWGLLPHEAPGNTRGRRYSLLRAIGQAASTIRDDGTAPGSPVGGLEGEVSAELAKRYGVAPRGFLVPPTAIWPETRALTTTSGSGAVPVILGGRFIDALRNRTVLGKLGSPMLSFSGGESGQVKLSRRISGAAVSWAAEGAAPSNTNLTTDAVLFTPKTVTAVTDVTRKMLRSGGPDFEQRVLDDIASGIGHEIDRVGLNGDGTNNSPVGVLQTSGIGVVELGADGGAPTRAALVELERTVGNLNADGSADASLGFAGSPNARAKLRLTDGSTAGSGKWLWGDDDRVLSSPAYATASIPSDLAKGTGTGLSALLYGDFTQLAINLFSPLDILVDPFKQSTGGVVRLSVFQDLDVQLFHAEAFAAILDMVAP